MKTINGSRIELARKIQGYTQKQLAYKVGVNQSAINHYEQGKITPPDNVLNRIAVETGFTTDFFNLTPLCELPKGSLAFRAARSVTAKEIDKAYYNAKLVYEQYMTLAGSFALPNVKLPVLKEKPEKAAEITRVALELAPDLPIRNLTNALERNGVIVLSLPVFLNKLDAFSLWVELQGERPLVAESFGKPGDRLRFSLAHEVGHLVMHHPPKSTIKLMEKEANDFATFLLMPRNVAKNEFTLPVSLFSLGELKVKWGISIQALIFVARKYDIITERQATYLFSQISSKGWKTKEPQNLEVKTERPQLFRKMIDGLYQDTDKFAKDMCLSDRRATESALFA
jgi:Zn-dependent peptidase ImmA (M78 family)/DNA-binding XRE family transcriptional regulator